MNPELTYPIVRMNLNNTAIEFKDAEIIKATVIQETHPISLELPISQLELEIYTEDPRFSIFSDGEFYDAMSMNTPMDLFEYVDGVEVFVGRFYIDERYAPTENKIEIEAWDVIGVYAKTEYLGNFFELPTPISEVIPEILNPVGIPYTIAANIVERTVKGWIKPGNVREALQQVCFAAQIMVNCARSEGAVFLDSMLPVAGAMLPYGYYDEFVYDDGTLYNDIALQPAIVQSEQTNKLKLTHLPLVTGVVLFSHDYYHPAEGLQNAEEIFNGWLEPGDYQIPYKKPFWKVWASGVGSTPIVTATEDGRVIVTEGSGSVWPNVTIASESEMFTFLSNYVDLHVVTAGQVVIQGYPWLDNVRVFRYDEAEATKYLVQGFYYDDGTLYDEKAYSNIIVQRATTNSFSIEDATLVSAAKAPEILSKTVEYFKLRYQQNVRLFPNMTLKLGDIQVIDSLYQKDIVGITEKLVSDLTGGFLIDAEFVGLERSGS